VLIAPKHAFYQITEGTPEIATSFCQAKLLYEQYVVLEAGVQVWLEAEIDDDRVVVAVDVRVDAIEALEDLQDQRTECSWELDADARREHCFVVDVGLDPGH